MHSYCIVCAACCTYTSIMCFCIGNNFLGILHHFWCVRFAWIVVVVALVFTCMRLVWSGSVSLFFLSLYLFSSYRTLKTHNKFPPKGRLLFSHSDIVPCRVAQCCRSAAFSPGNVDCHRRDHYYVQKNKKDWRLKHPIHNNRSWTQMQWTNIIFLNGRSHLISISQRHRSHSFSAPEPVYPQIKKL